MNTGRDPNSRLRQALNPLRTTSLGGFAQPPNTPHSAISAASAFAYSQGQSQSHTPQSSILPYNPQEWAPSPAVGPERSQQFPPPAGRPEAQAPAAPLPPPPYSPPRSQRPVSTAIETPPANIAMVRVPPASAHRPTPSPPSAINFPPPPPGAGARGASRERRFGLPSLSLRRRETADAPAPLAQPQPQPLSIQIPTARLDGVEAEPLAVPPGARRAASASAVETPVSARSRSASQTGWGPSMTVPPPPPGPPPTTSRSQSLNRTPEPIVSPPTRRPPPQGIAALGPVPPTPANWVEEERQRTRAAPPPALAIDTSSASTDSSHPPDSASGSSSAGGQLARAGAVRCEKSLRERRTESRTRSARGEPSPGIQPLADIVVPPGANATPSRRGPRSSGRVGPDTPGTGGRFGDALMDSRHTTPRQSGGLHSETPTPPFSPTPQKTYPVADQTHPIAPKALPTPPPQSRSASTSSMRPDAHATPGGPMPATPVSKHTVISQTAEQFSKDSMQRFQSFAEQEASAASDADRVKLFAEFIVNESRLRRERYNSAIGAMGSEIFDLTRDLFRPMRPRRDSNTSQASEWTPQMSESKSNRNSIGSILGRDPAAQSHSAPPSAKQPSSPSAAPSTSANWQQSNFMPSLSPILSMSISEALDESSSRGRPASRWWETDSNGEQVQRMERSKRESKYMGVPKEAREALQWHDAPNSSSAHGSSSVRDSGEYPPEKVGWHEQDESGTPQAFQSSFVAQSTSVPNTPSPSHLDISRLVTIPPPYPRHHPAVNNNHPELTSIRTTVRSLSDMTEMQQAKEAFQRESQQMREEFQDAAKQRKQALRINLQQEVSSGNMSYAEAAAIEADSSETEKAQAKELEKKDFERFQTAVVRPLNEMLTARIHKATALFDELRSRLFVDTHASNPNLPQEEGDEQPELLEKLTLLKWIFEAREMLHRAIYELLSDRNDRYRDMIVRPYQLAGNEEKAKEATTFFADDAAKRRAAFASEVLQRTHEFRGVVAENVERGVDMQLNAFWDTATPLKDLLDKIPAVLDGGFRVQVPAAEYDENPSYHAHPLQYLYSLLLHAEKSTYQFIESQTNLLCLLHEVKEAVMGARARAHAAAGDDADVAAAERAADQARATADLQEKVRLVHDSWEGALGDAVRGVKERVGEWLLSTGGWDESLEDRGVGAG